MRSLNSRTMCLAVASQRFSSSPGGVNSDSIEVGRCDCQDTGECPVRLAKQRVGRERCEGCEMCCADQFGLSRLALWTGVHRRTSGPALARGVLCYDGEQMLERSRWQDSQRAVQGTQVRASTTTFCGDDPLHVPWGHEGCGESRADKGGRCLPWCV